jgi:hypothetical protein
VAPIDAHRVLAIFRRRRFDFLTILSLLLCLATVALWVRSYWRYDGLTRYCDARPNVARIFQMRSNFGELGIDFFQYDDRNRRVPGWQYLVGSNPRASNVESQTGLPPSIRVASFLSFGYVHGGLPSYFIRAIYFPHWFLVLLLAILPASRLRSILRTRHRHRAGLCPHCGYDLRATPDRCPECGHAPKAAADTPSPRGSEVL